MTPTIKASKTLVDDLKSLIGTRVEIVAVRGYVTGILTEIHAKYLVVKTSLSRVIVMLDQVVFAIKQETNPASGAKEFSSAAKESDKTPKKPYEKKLKTSRPSKESKPILKKVVPKKTLTKANPAAPPHLTKLKENLAENRRDLFRRLAKKKVTRKISRKVSR